MNDRHRSDWQLVIDRRREMEILWRAIVTPVPDAVDSSQPEAFELLRDLRELQARVRFRLRARHLRATRDEGRSRVLNGAPRLADLTQNLRTAG